MRVEGNPFLLAFNETMTGIRIKAKHYSMGTYHWGGRSSCTKCNNDTLKATATEVYKNEPSNCQKRACPATTRYIAFALDARRINLTLLCL
jgi:hypothetical protein